MQGRRIALAAVVVGCLSGALGAAVRLYLGVGALDAFVNSISVWLAAAFLVGALATSRREAALAGCGTCVFQLVGWYLVAHEATASLVAFWTACAVLGGPVFALAGHLWRTTAPGLGMAVLAGAFVAEGLYAEGVVWIVVGLALALLSRQDLRWLALTVPVGVAGQAALTALEGFF